MAYGVGDAPSGGRNGVRLADVLGPVPLSLGPYTASGQVASTGGVVTGWTIRNTAVTGPSVARLWDGTSNTGQTAADVSVNQGDTDVNPSSFPGVGIRNGLYLEVVSGNVSVVIWWIPDV